jgi:dolichol-phosphate mannosyltransferase
MTDSLWIVFPVYNEEACVAAVLREWIPTLRECTRDFVILALNDGSTDATLAELRKLEGGIPEMRVIDKPNAGHGQSCVQGYRMALEAGAEWIFQIDSDGQCDPSFFPGFWSCRNPEFVDYGYRTIRGDGRIRFYVSRVVSIVTWIATGIWVRDPNVPYRLMHRSRLEGLIDRIPEDFHLANIMLAALHQKTFGIRWHDIYFRQRIGGVPSAKPYSFAKHGFQLFRQLRAAIRTTEPVAQEPS